VARAATAGLGGVDVIAALRLRALVRDSVGLSGADRQPNIAACVKSTTASESVRVLHIAGAHVAGVLAIANA